MIEPVYEYVKGKGWVIPEYPIVTMRCGTVVRLEPRMPEVGETWLRSTSWLNPDGSVDMEAFKQCACNDYESYALLCRYRKTTEESLPLMRSYEISAWVTVKPVVS